MTLRAPHAALLLSGLVALLGCGGPEPVDPVQPRDPEGMAPLVGELVRQTIAQVEARPDSAELHGRLGLVYEANAMQREAAEAYSVAIQLDPSKPVWTLRRGITLLSLSETEEGRRLILECEQRMPESAAVHHRIGYMHLDDGDPEAALESFRVASALGWAAAQPFIQTSIGEALAALGQAEAALEPLEQALEAAPTYKVAHYAYGLALRDLGRMEEAERELQLGLDAERVLVPDNSDSEIADLKRGFADMLQRAEDEAIKGNPGRAKRIFEDLLRAFPGDPIVLNNYAGVYLTEGDWEQGLALIDQALEGGSRQFGLFVNRSRALRGLGKLVESRAAADTAIGISPEIFEGHMERARTCLSQRDLVNARESLRRAIALNDEDPSAYLMLAEVCTRLGFVGEACAGFERVTELRPGLLPPRVNAARLYLEAGQLANAERALRGAEEIAPAFDAEAQERVRLLRAKLETQRNGGAR